MAIDIDEILNRKPEDTGGSADPKEQISIEPEQTIEPEEPEYVDPVQEEHSNDPVRKETVEEFPKERFGGKFNSWDEVEKAVNREPESPFKDDFIKKVVDVYNSKGSLEDFFKAYSVEWDKMPAEDILRADFEEKYKGLDKKYVNRLWEKEKAKYNLDPDDNTEEDIELGKALMERDADEIRRKRLSEREQYLQPAKKEEAPKIDIEQVKNNINNIPQVKDLREKRMLSYKIGDRDFNLEVGDPDKITEALVDENNFLGIFVKNGRDGRPEVDIEFYADVVNYAYNREKVREALVSFGKNIGKEEIIDGDYKNDSLKKRQPDEGGSSEDFMTGLAKAFAEKGKTVKSR